MPPRLGILAGAGELPVRIIERCKATGREVFVIAFEDQTPPATVAGVPHAWVRLGAAGRAVELLHGAGARELVLAGRIHRPSLAALRPDAWGARFMVKAAMMGDDGLLRALVAEMERREGFRVVGVDELLPEALAPEGVLGAHRPDARAQADIERGFEVAHGLGALDVGQAVVVQQGLVLAVEAIEGTDAMIARAACLAREGEGGVLVKVRKPGQERRADLPTIGVTTVQAAAAAGLKGVAIEAGATLVVGRDEVTRAADDAGLFVIGVAVGGHDHG